MYISTLADIQVLNFTFSNKVSRERAGLRTIWTYIHRTM